jgi:hypothetical protein
MIVSGCCRIVNFFCLETS